MNKLLSSLTVSVLMSSATIASAQTQDKGYAFKAAIGGVLPVAFPKGAITPAPLSMTLGSGLSIKLASNVAWYTELGIATTFTAFNPNPRLVAGPCLLLTERTYIGLAALGQINPGYGDLNLGATVGLSALVGLNAMKGLSLVLGAGGTKTLAGSYAFSVQPRLMFTL